MDTYHYAGEVSWKKILRPRGQGTLTCYTEGGGPGAEDAFSWRYEGDFDQGRATGQGTTTYGEQDDGDLRGQIYTGAHVNGEAHGQGTWYYPDGAVQYVGDHQNGEYDGQGTSYRRDGNTMQYEGTWLEGYWNGNGTLYRRDGTISRNGEWVNGDSAEHERQGETCWYEGDWDEEGSPHGWGILYRPDRIIVECEGWWQNGAPVDGPPPGYPDAP